MMWAPYLISSEKPYWFEDCIMTWAWEKRLLFQAQAFLLQAQSASHNTKTKHKSTLPE
jgi:hypothetical protein